METKMDTITLRGPSDVGLEFDIYSLESELRHVSCVFIVIAFYKDDVEGFTHKIIYAGQTDDIKINLDAHIKWDCFYKHHANCLGIYQENSENRREMIEASLIKKYHSPLHPDAARELWEQSRGTPVKTLI